MKSLIVWALLAGWFVMLGCSSDPPKPSHPQPTSKDVRNDSDRFFDKMKQDEKEHGQKKDSAP